MTAPSPAEIRLPIAQLSRRFRQGADGSERRGVQDHRAGETQASRLADRAKPGVFDPLEVDIVREAEDAADDLRRRKRYRVTEQPVHVDLPLGLKARRAGVPGEQRCRVRVAMTFGV